MDDQFKRAVLSRAEAGDNMLLLFRGDVQRGAAPLMAYVREHGNVLQIGSGMAQLKNGAWIVCRRHLRVPPKVFEAATKGFKVVVMEK